MRLSSHQNRTHYFILAASLVGLTICLAVASVRLRGLLINSSLLAGGALLISIPLGTFLAIAIAKTSCWGKQLLERSLIALLFVPLFVQAAAWQATIGQGGWLANNGWLTGWRGAIWIHGVAAIPWVVLFVTTSLRKVPRELEEETLQDAASLRVLLQVSLKHALASIFAAALWVTVICFSEITVTDLFQVRTFAEEIYTAASLGTLNNFTPDLQSLDLSSIPQFAAQEIWLGTATIVLLITATLSVIWIGVPVADWITPTTGWVWQLQRGRPLLSFAVWLLMLAIVGTPILGLVGKAGLQITQNKTGMVTRHWSITQTTTMMAHSPWEHRRELGWSLTIGGAATLIATSLATLLAWSIRTRRLPLLPTTFVLSLGFAIPGPLLGVWTIRCLNHPSDSLLWPLAWCYDHTILAPTFVQFLRALPLATLILAAQFASLPQETLDSARSEGASWWRQLLSIALPWCWSAIITAACMSMIVAIGELAATLLVVSPGVSTLSVRIFGLLHYGAEDRVAALCLMLALLLGTATALVWRLPKFFEQH